MSNEIIARFSDVQPKSVSLQIKRNNGTEEYKEISLDNYFSLIQGSLKEDILSPHGKLPSGYYDSMINHTVRNHFKVLVTIPEGKYHIKYFDRTYFVPFPKLVFCFYVEGGKCTSSSVFSLKGECHENAELFMYPFGNVSGDGSICWGDCNLSNINEMYDVNLLVATFMGANTNNDLYGDKIKPISAVLKEIKELDEFPLNQLVPIRTGSMRLVSDLLVKD